LAQDDPRDCGTDKLDYDNEFWRFSLAVYEQAEVAQECLALQQALGIDVNLLLFCAWVGTRAVALSSKDIEAVSIIVSAWHENVVRPLRGVRQQVKILYQDEFGSFRTSVKGIELEAEQIEQAMLFAYSKRIQSPRASADCHDAIAQNVKEYIEMKSGTAAGQPPELSAPRLIDAARRLSS
jgi:uncharacterized protein (TIGR02444 family)